MQDQLQQRIVVSARSWIGTRFHHQGRTKASSTSKGGVDCLGLLVGVAKEQRLRAQTSIGCLLTEYDETDYGHIPDGGRLKATLDKVLQPIAKNMMAPGDVVLIQLEKQPQHLGILSDYALGGLGLVHALASARKVVEHSLDELWLSRIVQAYRVVESQP